MSIKDLFESVPEIVSSDEKAVSVRPFYFDFVEQGILSHGKRGRDHPYFHPSFYYPCLRCMVLSLLGHKMVGVSLSSFKRFDAGTYVHEKWFSDFNKSGLLFSSKHRIWIEEPAPVAAEPDIIVLNHATMELFQVEIKSRETHAFGRQAGPLASHVRQWQIYSYVAEKFYGIKCDRGWIHYEDINFQGWKAFPMVKDNAFVGGVLKKYAEIYEIAMSGVIPSRECSLKKRGDKLFNKCPARDICPDLD